MCFNLAEVSQFQVKSVGADCVMGGVIYFTIF